MTVRGRLDLVADLDAELAHGDDAEGDLVVADRLAARGDDRTDGLIDAGHRCAALDPVHLADDLDVGADDRRRRLAPPGPRRRKARDAFSADIPLDREVPRRAERSRRATRVARLTSARVRRRQGGRGEGDAGERGAERQAVTASPAVEGHADAGGHRRREGRGGTTMVAARRRVGRPTSAQGSSAGGQGDDGRHGGEADEKDSDVEPAPASTRRCGRRRRAERGEPGRGRRRRDPATAAMTTPRGRRPPTAWRPVQAEGPQRRPGRPTPGGSGGRLACPANTAAASPARAAKASTARVLVVDRLADGLDLV